MPQTKTKGAASAQGFGEFAKTGAVNYIEDVFSTTLYAGTGSYTAVDVGLSKLAATGGLCWFKGRTTNIFTENHKWYDTARSSNGGGGTLVCNPAIGSDQSAIDNSGSSTTFYPTGTAITVNGGSVPNNSNVNYVVWTFRKQAKFFDVVTYTGNGVNGRAVAHNLGSTPGMVVVKVTNSTGSWWVWHRSYATYNLNLDSTAVGYNARITSTSSTTFTITSDGEINADGYTYVAYLFAHNAGGFGLSGTDNVISCGSFTTTASNDFSVTLGYEPQWLMIKAVGVVGSWFIEDNTRGFGVTASSNSVLSPNLANAEVSNWPVYSNSTGFNGTSLGTNRQFIYIAIRRGPMKVPTNGTSVFAPNAYAGGTAGISFNLGFAPDALLTMRRNSSNFDILQSRLIGQNYLFTNTTDAELGGQSGIPAWDAPTNTISLSTASSVTGWNGSGSDYVNEAFARAPGFFDVVCYTGDGTTNRAITHNLTVIPEFIINKPRSYADYWEVYHKDLGVNSYIYLNSTNANGSSTGNWSSMTASAFGAGYAYAHNRTSETYVTYLFATVAGVSKVGSYTGTGNTLQIDCGFTGGARFVLIKRTDSTGDWYVYDSARGIVAGDDPYLLLNSTAAEVTNTDYVDSYSAGFELSSTAPAALNANGGTYIFLAIA